ncbi:MAG TPA: prepilin-type N-terminal cleavage/methylation domain-containing protein [Polyangiaceae bacterium]|nr:prepilin-type N-terminal cleavage/methylation domain-containing protein [Polyangiaceae bacterium]
MRLGIRQGLPIGQGPRRGFTLLELIAVVTIIAVTAALAIPTAVIQLRDRRVQEAARRIGTVYREARLRALGRGSAVLVRFTGGDITVHEARVGVSVGGEAGCADLPVSSCLNTNWSSPAAQRVVDGYSRPTSGELSNLSVAITDSANAAVPNLDICFTPMGRGFSRRENTNGPFSPLSDAFVATVSRTGLTRTRQVVMMPNGTARLFAE